MNDINLARRAYGDATQPVRSARDTEYLALARLSHGLRDTARAKNSDFPSFADAISRNLAFWSAVAVDVSNPGNQLPEETRAGIFWLAQFVKSESARLLRGEGDVEALVDVNINMMQGLRPVKAEQ